MNDSGDSTSLPASGSTTPTARSRIESLSREELVQRCKALLSIAHKSKLAKDEAIKEVALFKQKLIESDDAQQRDAAKAEDEKERISKQEQQLSALGTDLERQIALVAGLQSRLQQQTTLVTSLQSEVTKQTNLAEGLQRSAARLEGENDALLSRLDKADELRRAAEACVATTQEDLMPFKEMADTFKARWREALEELAAVKSERDELAAKLEKSSSVETGEQQNGVTKGPVEENKNNTDEPSDSVPMGAVWQDLQAERARCRQLEADLQQQADDNNTLKQKLDTLTSCRDGEAERCADLERKCAESAAKLQELAAADAELQKSLQKLMSENERLVEESAAHRGQLDELVEQKGSLLTEREGNVRRLVGHLHQRDAALKRLIDLFSQDTSVECSSDQPEDESTQAATDLDYDCDAALQVCEKILETAINQQRDSVAALTDMQESRTTLQKHNGQLLQEMNEMNQALKERSGAISRLEEELQATQAALKRNIDEVADKDDSLKQTQVQLAEVQAKLAKTNGELSDAKSKVAEVQTEHDTAQAALSRIYSQLEKALSTLVQSQNEAKMQHGWGSKTATAAVEEQLQKATDKVEHGFAIIERLSQENQALRKKIEEQEELQKGLVGLHTEDETVRTTIIELAKEAELKLEVTEDANQRLNKLSEKLQCEKAALEATLCQTSGERDSFKTQCSELDSLTESLKLKIVELQQTESALRTEAAELKAFTSDLEGKVVDLETEVSELKATYNGIKAENEALKKSNVEAQQLVTDLRNKQEDLVNDRNKNLSELTTSNEISRQRIQELEKELSARTGAVHDKNVRKENNEEVEASDSADISEELKRVLEERDRLQSRISELETEVGWMRGQHAELESSMNALKKQCFQLENDNSELKVKAKSLKDLENQVLSMKESLAVMETENKALKIEANEFDDVSSEVASWKEKFKEMDRQSRSMKEERDTASHRAASLETENTDIKAQLARLQEEKGSVEERISEIVKGRDDVQSELATLQAQHSILISKCADIEAGKTSTSEALERLETSFTEVQNQKDGALSEKNVLEAERNTLSQSMQTLKSELDSCREALSSAEAQLSSATTITSTLKSELAAVRECLSSSQAQLTDSYAEAQSLREQVVTLREELAGARHPAAEEQHNSRPDQSETQSEVLSTSTALSRADEASRMRDVEDSIEERYHKLRSLAVKLKKRVSQLQLQLSSESEQRQAALTELAQSGAQLTAARKEATALRTQAQNVQALQASCDGLQDQLDAVTSQERALQKEFARAAEQLAQARADLAAASEERDVARANVKSLTDRSGELEGQLATTAVEKSTLESDKASLEDILIQQKERADAAETEKQQMQQELDQLCEEREQHSAASGQLQQLQEQMKLLQQQLADAAAARERAETELGETREQLASANEELQGIQDRAVQLQASVRDSSAQVESLQTREKELQLTSESLRKDLEAVTRENEALNLAVAESTRNATDLTQTQQSLRRQVATLETRSESLEADLTASKAEQQTLRAEFDQYKLRAKAVLKKAQTAQRTTASEEEREALRSREETIEALQRERDQIRQEAVAAAAERDTLQQEVGRLHERTRRFSEQAAEADARWRQQLEKLRADSAASIAGKDAALQTLQHRLSGADQTRTSQEDQDSVASALRSELASVQAELRQHQEELGAVRRQAATARGQGQHPPRQKSPPSPIDVASMEREAAEGSENVTPQPTPSKYTEIVPLERLLSFNEDSLSTTSHVTELTSTERDRLATAEGDLASSRRNEAHLTALLNESEASNAKLTQLCDALKAEIRRTERSEERQKHLNQMEYLKNVIVKFVALNEGDERVRLVPVLATMLRLTPEEVAQLNKVASGGDPPGKEQGWGSYLHLWSGGSP